MVLCRGARCRREADSHNEGRVGDATGEFPFAHIVLGRDGAVSTAPKRANTEDWQLTASFWHCAAAPELS